MNKQFFSMALGAVLLVVTFGTFAYGDSGVDRGWAPAPEAEGAFVYGDNQFYIHNAHAHHWADCMSQLGQRIVAASKWSRLVPMNYVHWSWQRGNHIWYSMTFKDPSNGNQNYTLGFYANWDAPRCSLDLFGFAGYVGELTGKDRGTTYKLFRLQSVGSYSSEYRYYFDNYETP